MKDHLHVSAASTQVVWRKRGEIDALELYPSICWRRKLQYGTAGCRLPTAGFTNQPKRLAPGDIKADPAYGFDRLATRCGELDHKPLDLQQYICGFTEVSST